MTLIKSISGIRGTIGGQQGDGLSPIDVTLFTSAYVQWIKNTQNIQKGQIVVGRDARISGEMVQKLVIGTIMSMGFDALDIDLATTPTTEIAVENEKANGGLILTASHNPKQWNALKLLNEKGEFLSAEDGEMVLKIAEEQAMVFADVDELGKHFILDDYTEIHIQKILDLKLVDKAAIEAANFTVAIDAVNSVGGIAIPMLLDALGVKNIKKLYCDANGNFPHNPEPLPENLTEISELMQREKADVGFVVDPDVDRLAVVNSDGSMFGEEYTLVAVADYILQNKKGNTVSNLSSSRALRDVTQSFGKQYFASAVGEVNVVAKMKAEKAVIGGEGNGGIIYPELHYGRDALVGIALLLTYLAKAKTNTLELKSKYPKYIISKNKVELTPEIDVDAILEKVAQKYADYPVSTIDGVKIDFEEGWVHLRKSNTEPIIRIYSESESLEAANSLAKKIMDEI
ncbi:MAG: phosphoglucosamine mutase [Bacteroidales bacterium]|nr:phosphoglucosamine mutase [Bacteroidales bacterium]